MSPKYAWRISIFSVILFVLLSLRPAHSAASERMPAGTKAPSNGSALIVEDLSGPLTPEDLASALVGAGVSISNVSYTGADLAAGAFNGGNGIIGFDAGVLLSSGKVSDVVGPNQFDAVSTDHGLSGDPDLTALSGYGTYDAAVLEFDFIPDSDLLSFQFVFSSDEYNEFVNTQFNDVFAFFINGTNCAQVEGDAISVNTINFGNPYGTEPNSHPELYINNDIDDGGATLDTEMDGLTKVLSCSAVVNPGVTHHIKLAIADASDAVYDTNVFIQAGSVTTERRPVILLPGLGASLNKWCFFTGSACNDEDEWSWMPTAASYYEPLIERLAEVQYTEENGYFNVFFYDWTEPLASNISRLKQRIAQVKAETGVLEVDLIGHSMGGLLGRAYVQSDSYIGDVAHLITLGSPHRGAAKAYPYWEGGHLYQADVDGMYKVGLNMLIAYFKVKEKTPYIMTIIQEEVSGVKDILPTETYLYEDESGFPILESQMEHRNMYLSELNQSLDTLYDRTSLATFVSSNVPGTAHRFFVRDRYFWEWPKWDDGVPVWDRGDEFLTDLGDGTVPANSARLNDPRVYVAEFSGIVHSEMAANNAVINEIFSFLGISVAPAPVDFNPLAALVFYTSGPAEITVTDPLGRQLGYGGLDDVDTGTESPTDIPDAEYISFPSDPFKMGIIPGPIEGVYTVEISGNEQGAYSLGVFDSEQAIPDGTGEWDEFWDSLVTETQEGVVSTFVVSYTENISDVTQFIAVTPIVEKPLYWSSYTVMGRALPGNSVAIYDADNGDVLGTGLVGSDGRFSVTVSEPLQLGQRVFAQVNGESGVPVTVEASGVLYLPTLSGH